MMTTEPPDGGKNEAGGELGYVETKDDTAEEDDDANEDAAAAAAAADADDDVEVSDAKDSRLGEGKEREATERRIVAEHVSLAIQAAHAMARAAVSYIEATPVFHASRREPACVAGSTPAAANETTGGINRAPLARMTRERMF
ncbi:hypothetical protein G6O67_004065 [Ophiocordyceps sinensis]|uniref:Uncharacterized protein n=1 Tax=Ophiocordyceps sinensis TaxID=72228 RepID=A0A8H4PNS3_9HYPO|nr:hypothetical protein G6O67_004065 [Ophiocordyceps sinensis]